MKTGKIDRGEAGGNHGGRNLRGMNEQRGGKGRREVKWSCTLRNEIHPRR